MPHHPALERLGAYYHDLGSGRDAKSIAHHFRLPALLIIGEDKLSLTSADTVEEVYARLLDGDWRIEVATAIPN